jgi:pectate lyase
MKLKKLFRLSQYVALSAASSLFATGLQAQTLGSNLAVTGPGAGADGSGFDNVKLVRDGNTASISVAKGTSNQRVSIKWGSAVTFNRVILRESGSKITSWQLVDNDSGTVYATGTTIGAEKIVDLGSRTSKKINLIVSASSAPGIAELEVYNVTGTTTSISSSSSRSSSISTISSSRSSSASSISSSRSSSSSIVTSSIASSSSRSSSSVSRSSSSVVSSSVSSVASSRSSSVANNTSLSEDCIRLATNPSVNWRDTSLKTDQEIVSCLSKTLGTPVGYGEKAS